VLAAGRVLQLQLDQKSFRSAETQKTQTVLQNIILEIQDQEFVCLFGPSGCGKTTLLNLIAGIDSDFKGRLTFGLAQDTEHQVQLGYVFQDPLLLPWMTVENNIRLVLPKSQQSSDLPWRYLERMGVGHVRKAYPGELSLGMARRVSLARAFAVQPQLLLMDEPFVSLDQQNAEVLRELMMEVWLENRCAVLLVTHDLDEAIRFADRIIFFGNDPTSIVRESLIQTQQIERNSLIRSEIQRQLVEQN
jgi:NitT/TauT family transport system ATP-binding protein